MGQSHSKSKIKTVPAPPFEKYGKTIVIAFITQIEQLFDQSINIPDEIILLCFKFYQMEHNLYLMDHTPSKLESISLYAAVMDGEQNWKINTESLYGDSTLIKGSPQLIHYKHQIQLPSKIAADVSLKYGYQNKILNRFDCIFSADHGGNAGNAGNSCIIIDPSQFNNKNEEITGYEWQLPKSNFNKYSRKLGSSVFSSKYGLVLFNRKYAQGTKHEGLVLDIRNAYSDNNSEWEWIPIDSYAPAKTDRHQMMILPLCIMETVDHDEKLMVVGKTNIQLYDFQAQTWSNNEFVTSEKIEKITNAVATCYDKRFQRLYVERGSSLIDNKTYCYDMEKMTSYCLPSKTVHYKNLMPMVLFQKYDLLFCANGIMNPIQYLDLRENYSKKRKKNAWKIIDKPFSSLISQYGASHRLVLSCSGDFDI